MNDSKLKDSKMMTTLNPNSPLMYIIVIGFHHKKGCQVEFVFPCNDEHIFKSSSTEKNDLYKLPKNWKHLPSLALPDGSHNYDSDCIYFHLEDDNPSGKTEANTLKPNKTIFGISCYRQINASEIINKDSDVTRNTLQKSVCILSCQPIYSNLKLKLVSITNAFFDQKDFNKTDILVQSFISLTHSFDYNSSLFNDLSLSRQNKSSSSNYLIGLTLSDLVLRYQHKILVLFKLVLLQKKCLFQLKPVSNLSNTIMSLVSLLPDLYDKNGLSYCSGFFDSIDLVNCELERKNINNNKSNKTFNGESVLSTSILFTQSENMPSLNNQFSANGTIKHKRKKSKKRKVLSFSHKKNNNTNQSTSNSNYNISLTENTDAKLTYETNNSNNIKSKTSLLSSISTNTQRIFSFKNQNNKNAYNNENNKQDESIVTATDDNNENSLNKSKLDIKMSRSSNSINENAKQQNLDENHGQNNGNFGNIIKSRVSGVFNNIWNSSSNNNNDNNINSEQQKNDNTSTPISKSKKKPSIPQIIQTDATSSYDIDLSELLEIDFGMPFNLFNEFNILHPYLSLYYLEYFTTINKMNTKLYCTTALMMNMMKDNINSNNNTNNDSTIPSDSNNQNEPGSGIGSVTASPASSEPTQFGYTIGATNILFKQRLYDDLDAFIDECDIDLKNNEQLKKQLQLTTADLRFADYIIKNVQAYQKSASSQVSSNNSTPTLLSFKKTNSFINNEKSPNNQNNNNSILLNYSSDESSLQSSPQQGANWEGSDDWIRLNFKWYLHSMLGSILKEDLYNLIKNELDHIYFNNNSNSNSDTNFSSASSGSQASLSNEVIDIDDYIDKCNQNDEQQSLSSQSQHHRKSLNNLIAPSDRKSSSTSTSTTSTLSSSKYYLLQSSSQSDFRDDFNSHYINELKKTQFFKQWQEVNKSKLEKTLLKFDVQSLESQLQQMNTNLNNNELNNINNKFQLLLNQMQELEKVKLNHPFSGQIGVNDIKLRLNVLFTTTESGRKLNKALIEGGKIMNNTGKAVGDALSQAKSTFNSFLSNWSANNSPMSSNQNSSQSVFINKSSKVINNYNQEDLL